MAKFHRDLNLVVSTMDGKPLINYREYLLAVSACRDEDVTVEHFTFIIKKRRITWSRP